MNKNPTSSLPYLIDKLISEYSSDKILVDKLGQIKDLVILLKTANVSLKNENASLINQIKDYEKVQNGLTKEQRDILFLLAGNQMNERDMIDALGRNAESIFFDLEALKALDLIESKHIFAGLDVCKITPKGRGQLKVI